MPKGAIIGFGEVCERAHIPALKADRDYEIVAVCDSCIERRSLAARLLPAAKLFPSAEAMTSHFSKLSSVIDFVDIAAPPHLHAESSLLALKHGLHVLCEKPLTLSLKEFETIRREASRRRRVVFPVHNWKHAPLLAKLRELLRERAVGGVTHIEWHVLRSQPSVTAHAKANWRTDRRLSGGGILMDHGWHALYLLQWLVGKKPLSAHGVLKCSGDTDREATCLIEFPGSTALMHLTWNAPGRGHWGVVYGNEGRVELQDDRLLVYHRASVPHTYSFQQPLSHGSAHPEWFRGTLLDFKAALADPAAATAALDEAGRCIALIEGLYGRSAALREEAALP
ncbi:MAG: Gfo/Idh/MocA family oxidoreductase [Elusimicrobiota bacterium]